MIFSKEDLEPKNSQVPNEEEMPKDKVERKDGLPTVDDLKEIMSGKDKNERTKDQESEKLGKMIKIIIEI
jgi:hypothetical protein